MSPIPGGRPPLPGRGRDVPPPWERRETEAPSLQSALAERGRKAKAAGRDHLHAFAILVAAGLLMIGAGLVFLLPLAQLADLVFPS